MTEIRLHMSDIPRLSLAQAQMKIDTLSDEANTIEEQLKKAMAEFKATGIRSDPRWYQAATVALKVRRRLITRLQQHTKELRAETK